RKVFAKAADGFVDVDVQQSRGAHRKGRARVQRPGQLRDVLATRRYLGLAGSLAAHCRMRLEAVQGAGHLDIGRRELPGELQLSVLAPRKGHLAVGAAAAKL